MSAINWTCPYCLHPQIGDHKNIKTDQWKPDMPDSNLGRVGTHETMKVCLNSDCQKISYSVSLYPVLVKTNGDTVLTAPAHNTWNLLPASAAKPQPDFIPKPLRDDYLEACLIRDLSPKASATLSRRCLQGMIRDFCGIAKGTLADEIKSLRTAVDEGHAPKGVTPDSVDAIDAVRKVGNIGAHMEKDINTIIEIDPQEAQLLIQLIEDLFADWYVERDTRQKRFADLMALGKSKGDAKNPGGSA